MWIPKWFKKKNIDEELPPLTEQEFEDSVLYAETLLRGILAESGDGVHLMQVKTTAMEDVNFLYGRKDPELYNIMPLYELTARVATRSHFLRSFMITVESFRVPVTEATFDPQILLDAEFPDEIHGWLIKDLEVIPLTAKQIFDFWYSDEDDETLKELNDKAVLQEYDPEGSKGKVVFRDAWDVPVQKY